ncbi:MAG TPA: response regulator [Candidatus Tumulicola sp.]|nr:response regulator [Candidatus Tumulicola sp.]
MTHQPRNEPPARAGTILVVDDDAEIRSLVAEYLGQQGYEVVVARDGTAMFTALDTRRPDLVVLDVMLPGEDGLALCRRLRAQSDLPVIMLTARGDDIDRIIGIEMGADDYLAKPFNPRELLARIRSVLRRVRAPPAAAGQVRQLRFAGWTLDCVARHLVDADGVVVPMSGAQFRLLMAFVDRPQRVLDRDQLLDATRGITADAFDRSIDVQISRLRQMLRDNGRRPRIIKTVRNGGYVLAATVERIG